MLKVYIDLCGLGQGIEVDIANVCISVYLSISWKDLENFTHAPAHGNTFFSFSLTSEGFPSCDVQAKGET